MIAIEKIVLHSATILKLFIIIQMQNYNNKLDFRATEANVKKRFPSRVENRFDIIGYQQPRKYEKRVSPRQRGKRSSPGETLIQKQTTCTKMNEQSSKERGLNFDIANHHKNSSQQKLRETSPYNNQYNPYRLRSSCTTSSMFVSHPFLSSSSKQLPLGSFISTRKSFGSEQKLGQSSDRSTQLSFFEQTLNNLSSKVLNVKKELEKRNDKHKEQKNIHSRYVISEEEPSQRLEQQSEISNQQSVNTVVWSKKNLKSSKIALSSLVQSVPKSKETRGFDVNPYSPRKHNQYYISEIKRAVSDKNSIARDHLLTSMRVIRLFQNQEAPTYSQIDCRKVNLKRKEYYKDKKTLVFDLDETLIHCNQNPLAPSDIVLTIRMDSGESIEASINIRPYAITLLNQLSKNFEIIVFTASYSCYADVVLDYIDPEHKIIEHRLYREHCFKTDKDMYIKDLRIINRGLHEMVLIDNASYSYIFQLENGIPIFPYYDGSNDFELKALESYLAKISTAKDVRQLNKKTFKLHHYHKYDTPEELVEALY